MAGVLCNPECPDKLVLGELTSNNWHIGVKIFVAVLIIGVALVCVIFKMLFMLWLLWLEKKQFHYINSLDEEIESVDHATLQVRRNFNFISEYKLNYLIPSVHNCHHS